MKVKVTQGCIDAGKPRKASLCPIALALGKGVKVFEATAIFQVRNKTGQLVGKLEIPLPLRAREFIARFDAHMQVKPFTFTLPIWLR